MILFFGTKILDIEQAESWGESKTDFKGEVYELKKRRGRGGEGTKNISSVLLTLPLSHPSSLSFFFAVKMAAEINVPLSFH